MSFAPTKNSFFENFWWRHCMWFVVWAPPPNQKSWLRLWFNPPFSESVKNNIGKEFLKLVDKHFPPHHHLRKVCNRNTLKVSYSCMPNMATIISSHNKNILGNKQEPKTTIPPGNCRNSANCSLNGECREKAVIYKASITSEGSSKHYIGCTETEFKIRNYNHTHSFRYREKRNATELSKTFRNAKDSGHEPSIKWSTADRATAYQTWSRSCNLCVFVTALPRLTTWKKKKICWKTNATFVYFDCNVLATYQTRTRKTPSIFPTTNFLQQKNSFFRTDWTLASIYQLEERRKFCRVWSPSCSTSAPSPSITPKAFRFESKLSDLAHAYCGTPVNAGDFPMHRECLNAIIFQQSNSNILITKPNKEWGLVVLNKTNYIEKLNSILEDEAKFLSLGPSTEKDNT